MKKNGKVILNIGHGGFKNDPGACANGYKEHCWNKDLVDNYIIPALEKEKIAYIKAEQGAYYSTLINKINEIAKNGDFFLSFHLNASDNPNSTGLEMLYYHASEKSKKIAEIFAEANHDITKLVKRHRNGILPRNLNNRGGMLLYKTKIPGIIIESGFITNLNEMKLLDVKKEELAISYVKAIKKILYME